MDKTVLNYFDLRGKCVLVTGGSRGLGRAMAQAFAHSGANLVIASRKFGPCEEAATEARTLGVRALPFACNVGHWPDIDALLEAAYGEYGKIDVLINNAGIAPIAPSSADVTEELFDKIVSVNFKGPFRLSALVGQRMVKSGGGAIINISSIAAVKPSPAYPVYAAAKAALNSLTQAHAFEFGPNVRVNAIMCGPFWTDIAKNWAEEADRTSQAATRRIGRPDEVATAALYLASPSSSFTTGSVIIVDGGQP